MRDDAEQRSTPERQREAGDEERRLRSALESPDSSVDTGDEPNELPGVLVPAIA
jgi:hypothetical protein